MARNSPHSRAEDSARLTAAVLLAVLLHLALAQLPLTWRSPMPSPVRTIRLSLPPRSAPVAAPVAASGPKAVPESVAPATQAVAMPAAKIAPTPKSAPNESESRPEPLKPRRSVVAAKTAKASQPKPIRSRPARPKRPIKTKPVRSKPIEPKPVQSKPTDSSLAKPGESDRKSPIPRISRHSTMPSSSAMADGGGSEAKPAGGTPLSRKRGNATTPNEVILRPLPGNPQPRYPSLARRRGKEGQVLLRLSVNAAGQVETIDIARSSGHDLLDEEARRTVARWRFSSSPAGGMVTQTITFHLRN